MAILQTVSPRSEDSFGVLFPSSSTYQANAGDFTTITFNVSENIFFISNVIDIVTCSNLQFSQNKLEFPNYRVLNGFEVGQVVELKSVQDNGTTTIFTRTIISIDYSTNIVEFDGLFGSFINFQYFDERNVLQIKTDETREDLYFNLNLTKSNTSDFINFCFSNIQNTYVGATSSYRASNVDGNILRFYGAGTGSIAIGTNINLVQQGFLSGGFSTFVNIERLANINSYTREFKITIETTQIGCLLPFMFENNGFIKLYTDFEWYTSNDTENPTVYAFNFANCKTGDFNEPFRNLGLTINAEFISEVGVGHTPYYDDLDNTYTITFDSTSPNINFGAMYVPNDETYFKNKYFNQSQLCMYINPDQQLALGTFTSEINPSGAGWEIEINSFSYVGNIHTVNYTIRKSNSQFETFIEGRELDDRNFIVWWQVGNLNLKTGNFAMTKSPKQVIDLNTYDFLPSVFRLDKTTITYPAELLSDGAIVNLEDNIQLLKRLLLPKSMLYLSLKLEVIVAEIGNLSNNFVLENAFFDLSNVPTMLIGGLDITYNALQPITENMPTTAVNFRNIIVTRKGISDTLNEFGLTIQYPLIINWRYWLAQPNAFLIFEDDKTKNWLPYDNGTYQIFVKTTFETDSNFLVHHAPIKKIYDYNEIHTDGVEIWNGTQELKYFINSSNMEVPCFINNEIIRVQMIVNNTDVSTLSTIWGQFTIEKKESQPRYLCSTNYNLDNNVNSPFLAISGETRIKVTLINPLQSKFEILVDTNKVTELSKLTFKYYNNSSTGNNEQFRTEYDVKSLYFPFPTLEDDILAERDECDCCEHFEVFAHLIDSDSFKNDVTSAWQVKLEPTDTVEFRLYKDGQLVGIYTNINFPNQQNAVYCTIEWQQVLTDNGIGKFELKVNYIGVLTQEYLYATYILAEYTEQNVKGLVRLKAIFNSNQTIQGINFTDAKVVDTLRVKGLFGKRDPKTEIKNLIHKERLVSKVTRENLNEYSFSTNPVDRKYSRKLLDLYFVSENEIFITDSNFFNHELYVEKALIVKEVQSPAYFDNSKLAVINCLFQDKYANQRSFY